MATKMAAKTKLLLVALLSSTVLVMLCGNVASATEDPELQQCKHQCRNQRQFDWYEKFICDKKCEDYIRQKQEIERIRKGEEEIRRRIKSSVEDEEEEDPQKEHVCVTRCRLKKLGVQDRRECEERCKEWMREKEGKREEKEEEEGEKGEGYPYVFEEKHFETKVQTREGRFVVLEKFSERSKLLRGIEKYRLGFLEANPLTFMSPCHWDSHVVFFVAKGRGAITMVHEEKRESFNVKCGDIVRVPAGTPVYMINRDENEKLFLVKFYHPVNLPGHFEAFFGPGGENPESFYTAFSWGVLEAALKTRRDKLERFFKQQKKGSIMKASEEQIKALSHSHQEGGSGGGIWPFGSEGTGPIHIFNKRPSQSNEFGELYEAKPTEHKQLQDLDLMVSFANITKGSMSALFYNSMATKIAFVINGEGYLEMACPHVSSSSTSESRRQSYQKINARLKCGTAFIVPAGHPFVTVASGNDDLQIVCFEVKASNNVRYPLAGRGNIVKQMEKEAKELGFGMPAREVDRVFRNQDEEFFFPGPKKQEEDGEHGRAYI